MLYPHQTQADAPIARLTAQMRPSLPDYPGLGLGWAHGQFFFDVNDGVVQQSDDKGAALASKFVEQFVILPEVAVGNVDRAGFQLLFPHGALAHPARTHRSAHRLILEDVQGKVQTHGAFGILPRPTQATGAKHLLQALAKAAQQIPVAQVFLAHRWRWLCNFGPHARSRPVLGGTYKLQPGDSSMSFA